MSQNLKSWAKNVMGRLDNLVLSIYKNKVQKFICGECLAMLRHRINTQMGSTKQIDNEIKIANFVSLTEDAGGCI